MKTPLLFSSSSASTAPEKIGIFGSDDESSNWDLFSGVSDSVSSAFGFGRRKKREEASSQFNISKLIRILMQVAIAYFHKPELVISRASAKFKACNQVE